MNEIDVERARAGLPSRNKIKTRFEVKTPVIRPPLTFGGFPFQ
jgi:hypothetical protein